MDILSSKQRSSQIRGRTRNGEPPQSQNGCLPAALDPGAGGSRRPVTGLLHRALSGCCLGFLVCLLLFQTGCALRLFNSSSPKAQVGSLQESTNASQSVTLTVLQTQVMRFADIYVATVSQACDDATANGANRQFRLAALRWKVGQATSAYTDASGQNPAINALDMLVLVTMARMVVEEYGVDTYGDAIQPLLYAQRQLETNAWTLASGVLKPAQQQELRDLIQVWRAAHPHQRYIGPIRFREFVTAMGKNPTPATTAPTSIFSLLFLDPLAGLDPTAAAIQETRELGERAMYYSQRMPQLVSWQTEELVLQLADQPESRQILSNAQQVANAATSFTKVSEQFPQLVNDQRQAAIQQLLDGLSSGGKQSQELIDDTRSTLNSAGAAATNVTAAIQALGQFVAQVSPVQTNGSPTEPRSTPFNVLDYGTAASQVGVAANNLNALLATVNDSVPRLTHLQEQSTAAAKGLVDRAFWLALALVIAFLVGAVAAALSWRILSNNLSRKGNGSYPSKS
jgi:hypothetical protein